MSYLIKPIVTGLATLVPLVVTEHTQGQPQGQNLRYILYFLAAAIVFFLSLVENRKEKAATDILAQVMAVYLDDRFQQYFREVSSRVPRGQRLPFRANIMIVRWTLSGKKMQMLYAFGVERIDSDTVLFWRGDTEFVGEL